MRPKRLAGRSNGVSPATIGDLEQWLAASPLRIITIEFVCSRDDYSKSSVELLGSRVG